MEGSKDSTDPTFQDKKEQKESSGGTGAAGEKERCGKVVFAPLLVPTVLVVKMLT